MSEGDAAQSVLAVRRPTLDGAEGLVVAGGGRGSVPADRTGHDGRLAVCAVVVQRLP
jgi:hypothetical protein